MRDEVKELQIGMKIRNLRQDRRLTLQDVADRTGLSKPLLSQIENNQVIPPLATLLRIAKAFGITLNCFFEDERDENKCILIRAGQQHSRQLRPSHSHRPQPYTYHSRAYGKTRHHMEPFDVEFLARQWHDDLLVRHEGEEFLYLLEGEVEFRYGDQTYHLRPGDSVYYDSSEPHGYIAIGNIRPRALAVLYSKS
ncbi:helix-turn-helix domain-containing protein [Desulfuromonas thiophila]|jgi:transcriptional regulator with XRE-family HTH domain|uniref:Transcriptional regulator, XRE family with cupin sensor n=1 Tax=Desulfuromonas thiophila TaxID=57664 RepID=A0A1G6ZLE9_9BACT|nr:cupin domain-containing protein [Desulfuromonas thiophila]MCK9172524.1 cupin domain-containing protein [Desulfuromonas thiophila]MDD3802338.1 cupin domain-containing protein [Desulfuromonas thiophila]MDY0397743.1 cupin domain-containing protein [Desulfuromonas thiophila]SDE02386.1 transcriptional regulator, XRE family with cupin sensor [Desulfuromonas thiophila]